MKIKRYGISPAMQALFMTEFIKSLAKRVYVLLPISKKLIQLICINGHITREL
jgi:hypothetical protein